MRIALNHFVALLCTFFSCSMSCFMYGLHTRMQYSNCGLINVFYNLIVVSLSLVTIVCLVIPIVGLAFFDASSHCLDGFALSCTITPKSISSSLTFETLPPISYDNSWFLFSMCTTEHFSRLNSICQACDHSEHFA